MKATIYIHLENEEAWKALENKSEWVNDMLEGNEPEGDKRIRKVAEEVFNKMLEERNYG